MNISILSKDSTLTEVVCLYNKNNNVTVSEDRLIFLEKIFYSKNDLLIIDSTKDQLPTIIKNLGEETEVKDLPIIFILDDFDFKLFEQLGYNLGEIDYLLKPISRNLLFNKLKLYQENIHLKNKCLNIENFILQYSQAVVQAQMIGIISHQWRQPLNIIATSIINLEIKSELDQLKHQDIEDTAHKIHTILGKTSNVIHDYNELFQISSKRQEFNTIDAYNKCLDLISPQFISNKIKIENAIPKKTILVTTYKNELCQALLALLSIMKDLILKKQNENNSFEAKVKLILEEKNEQIIFQIINKNIGSLNHVFHNGLTLNSLLKSSTNSYETKLFIAKQIIGNKLNGLLTITNINNDLIFRITI